MRVGKKRSQAPCGLLLLALAAVMFAGCLDNLNGADQDNEPKPQRFERRITHVNETGMFQQMAHAESATYRNGDSGFEIGRPEHFSEGWFVLDWSSSTQDHFDEIQMKISADDPFAPAWEIVNGSGILNLTIEKEQWNEPKAVINLIPYSSSYPLSAYVEVEWSVQVTLVEQVPLGDTEEEPEENSRGSNEPRG